MTCEILMTGFGWSISRPVGQQGWLLASFAGTAARNSAQHSTRHWLCHLLSGLDQGEAGSQVHWCWVCAEGLYFSFCCCCNSPQLICCFFQSLASNWKGRCWVRFCVCSCFPTLAQEYVHAVSLAMQEAACKLQVLALKNNNNNKFYTQHMEAKTEWRVKIFKHHPVFLSTSTTLTFK